jgi:hypothetical protein
MTKNADSNSDPLINILSLAACIQDALDDISRLSIGNLTNYLSAELNSRLKICSQLIKKSKQTDSAELAANFYQLGLLIGSAEAEIHACFTSGREKRKESKGGSHAKYQKYELILLRHLAYRYLGIYKEHVDAVLTFNEETDQDIQTDSFRRYYAKFKKGEKIWKSSAYHFTPQQMIDELSRPIIGIE